ncbi:unnamed protein product [[Candida] boidinii]|nr:unnamed protein product [[Candida] boidinii]
MSSRRLTRRNHDSRGGSSSNSNSNLSNKKKKKTNNNRYDEDNDDQESYYESKRQQQQQQQQQLQLQLQQDIAEDSLEEITRCICGQDELIIPSNTDPIFKYVDVGFFIQCEVCSVWQHGFCVGISDEDHSPDKYWCEQCKPNLHKLYTDNYGYKRNQKQKIL